MAKRDYTHWYYRSRWNRLPLEAQKQVGNSRIPSLSEFWRSGGQEDYRKDLDAWKKPTPLVDLNSLRTTRSIDFSLKQPVEKLPDRSLHFPRSWEREKKE